MTTVQIAKSHPNTLGSGWRFLFRVGEKGMFGDLIVLQESEEAAIGRLKEVMSWSERVDVDEIDVQMLEGY